MTMVAWNRNGFHVIEVLLKCNKFNATIRPLKYLNELKNGGMLMELAVVED
jgi:hypothetical protein